MTEWLLLISAFVLICSLDHVVKLPLFLLAINVVQAKGMSEAPEDIHVCHPYYRDFVSWGYKNGHRKWIRWTENCHNHHDTKSLYDAFFYDRKKVVDCLARKQSGGDIDRYKTILASYGE